jgi:hypothetical protein
MTLLPTVSKWVNSLYVLLVLLLWLLNVLRCLLLRSLKHRATLAISGIASAPWQSAILQTLGVI